LAFEAKATEGELIFVDTTKQFHSGDRDGSGEKFLNPSIGLVLDLIPRWSFSTRLFRYFEERSLVRLGNDPSFFISRTARCEAA
jgi:hypothetical protein